MKRLTAVLLGCCASVVALAYEEPEFALAATVDGIEYRQYQPYLVAETVVKEAADRDAAASVGFRRLFGYISGDNTTRAELARGATVAQKAGSTKIDMTAPVRQIPAEQGWSVAFIVPSTFDATNVPQPTDPDVYIRRVPGELMAVLRFSGRWTDKNINAHKAQLAEKLSAAGLVPLGEMVTAFYNAPFAPWFLRRNEVMVPVSRIPDAAAGQPAS